MINEALKLADELDALHQYVPSEAPAMIRRLVEELDKWEKDLHLQSHVLGFMEGKASQTEEYMMLQKPLSDEEIKHLASNCFVDWKGQHIVEFARAILRKVQEK